MKLQEAGRIQTGTDPVSYTHLDVYKRQVMDNGMEILIHVGIDTVDMNGDGFELFVKEGDQVKTGDPLISFTPEKIRAAGHPMTTAFLITDNGSADVYKRQETEIAAQAESASVSESEYYTLMYGDYATPSRIETFVEENLLASAYYNHLVEENQPADDEITAYYEDCLLYTSRCV